MDPSEAAAVVASLLIMFGSLTLIVRFITNSPRRRNLAEIEKLAKLKELGLLESYRGGKGVSEQLSEIQAQLKEHEKLLEEAREERDFFRKLLEDKKDGRP